MLSSFFFLENLVIEKEEEKFENNMHKVSH